MHIPLPASAAATQSLLAQGGYLASRDLSVAVFLCLTLKRPLFVEGEPGTGKTEIAKTLAATIGRRLIRLQCYEGLDAAAAVYEWNFAAQMLAIRLAEGRGSLQEAELFADRFLIRRPLLQALEPDPQGPPVLLIDELDRADEPFEAFLLEALSDFQVTVPELGVIKAQEPPIVIITSNRTREVHDAVKRRCLYHWVGYPSAEQEREILGVRVPGLGDRLSAQIVAFVQGLRRLDLYKAPGIAETLDWARALAALDRATVDPETADDTLGVLLKYQDDIEAVRGPVAQRLLSAAP
jgi:MoxR-like ATPase